MTNEIIMEKGKNKKKIYFLDKDKNNKYSNNELCISKFFRILEKLKFMINIDYKNIVNMINKVKNYNNEEPPKDIYFRGEEKIFSTALVPSLFRYNFFKLKKYKKLIHDDQNINILIDFEKVLLQLVLKFHKSELLTNYKELSPLELIALLRHYGNPARLLDFSTNAITALYFAVRNSIDKNDRSRSIVYVLNPYLLNLQISLGKFMGFIVTESDFSAKARFCLIEAYAILSRAGDRELAEYIFKRCSNFNKEAYEATIKAFIEKIKEIFKDEKEVLDEAYDITYEKAKKDILWIYSTPIAVHFPFTIPYMVSQEAVGVLFGNSFQEVKQWLKENNNSSHKSSNNNTDEKTFLENFAENDRRHLLYYINRYKSAIDIETVPNLIYKIVISPSCKRKIYEELIKFFNISDYEIFGNDIRYIKEKALAFILKSLL